MLAIFLLLVSLACFVIGLVLFNRIGDRDGQDAAATLSAVGAAAFVIFLVVFSHTFVPTNHAGLISVFGKNNATRYYPAGFNLKWPWEQVRHIDLSFSSLSFVDGEEGAYPTIKALTRDGITIDIPFSFTWAIGATRVAEVKSLLPADGVYTAALYQVARSSVRDTVAGMTLAEALDRPVLVRRLSDGLVADTALFYGSQGYAEPQRIIRFGQMTVRGVFPPENVLKANSELLSASTEAQVSGDRTRIPADRSTDDYVAVQNAQTTRAAVDNGNPVTVVMGDAAAVAITGPRR